MNWANLAEKLLDIIQRLLTAVGAYFLGRKQKESEINDANEKAAKDARKIEEASNSKSRDELIDGM